MVREIAQWLKVHFVPVEDLSLVFSRHMVAQKVPSDIRHAHCTHIYRQAKHT